MRTASNWKDYVILDTSDGEKLEKWGKVSLVRPDPQIIWKTDKADPLWRGADGHYHRSNKGGGEWEFRKRLPESWKISYGALTFNIRPTGFKHTGLFPEQAVNWDFMAEKIRGAGREINVLNLFAYTGGATLACAEAGANVCHVDASKGMVQWARDNAALNGLQEHPIRWITDDVHKFLRREIRRERRYDAVIFDPPTFGRGANGEMYKIERDLQETIDLVKGVLSEAPLFVLFSSHTPGLSCIVAENIIRQAFPSAKAVESGEMLLEGRDRPCPSGIYCRAVF